MAQYDTLEQIEQANRRLGHHWFDADTLRWFKSRLSPYIFGGRYFVSSERGDRYIWNGRRRYTVRRANDDGSVSTASEFGQFATMKGAQAAAISYATFGEPIDKENSVC